MDESDTPTCVSYQLKNGVKEEYLSARDISEKSNAVNLILIWFTA